MSIKVIIQAPGLNLQASVKDEALGNLIKITQEFRDQESTAMANVGAIQAHDPSTKTSMTLNLNEEAQKANLGRFGAAELLNQFKWETNPEKILLLAAWSEARGGSSPWKSADMEAIFKQAKESAPSNFPRDVKIAIKSGWIHTHTPRTYSVTRTGWNKIAEALSNSA